MLLVSHLLCIAIVASITVMENLQNRTTVMVQCIIVHFNKLLPHFSN